MSCLHVPDLDGLIPTAGSQPATVRAKRKATHHVPMTRQSMDLPAGGDFPEPYALVCTRGGEPASVRAESNGVNGLLVTAQRPYFSSSGYFPNLDGLVITAGGQPTPIRAKGDVDHGPSGRFQVTYRAPRLDIPQSNGLVVHASSQPAAIGTEGDRINPVTAQDAQRLIARKAADFPSRRGIPKGDRVGGILCRQPLSVATEGKRLDFLHLAGEAAQLFSRRHVPELDSLVPASRGESLPIGTERDGSDPTGVALEGAIQHEVRNGNLSRSHDGRRCRRDRKAWRLRGCSQDRQLERFKLCHDSGSLPRRQVDALVVIFITVEPKTQPVLTGSER